jgi:hypothetical protein
MENKQSGFFHTPVWYIIFAFIFALLAILASKLTPVEYSSFFFKTRIDLGWIFWVLFALTLLSMLPALKAILDAFKDRNWLPPFLRYFLEDPFLSRVRRAKRILMMWIRSRLGRLILACISTFVVVFLLWRSRAVLDDRVNSFLFGLVEAVAKPAVYHGPTNVMQVGFATFSDTYYRDCLQLVIDLKSAGAKAVLVGMVDPAEGRVRKAPDSNAFRYLRRLEKTGVVVFAYAYGVRGRIADTEGELRLSIGTYGIDERSLDENVRLCRIELAGMKTVYTNPLPDVTLELLRKYRGFASEVSPKQEGDVLIFGDFRIPVTKEGYSYSRERVTRWHPREIYAFKGLVKGDDTLRYTFWDDGIGQMRQRTLTDLEPRVKGKILLLDNSFGAESYLAADAYASAIQNVLDGKMTTKWESFHLWMSLICLLLGAIIAHRFRFFVAIPLTFFMGLVSLLICAYLYNNRDILVDVLYPLLSIAIAMATFPIIAMRSEA